MIRFIHALAAGIALATIAAFWTSTVVALLFPDPVHLVAVKTGIARGLWILIPALAVAGASGAWLGRGREAALVNRKRRRMAAIAANGLLVLVPCALWLANRAVSGPFDTLYAAIQALELLAGAVNIVLLGANAADGLRLAGRWRARRTA